MKTHLKNHKRKQGKIEMKDELEKLIEKRKLFDFLKTEEGKEMMIEAITEACDIAVSIDTENVDAAWDYATEYVFDKKFGREIVRPIYLQ
jgi:hypothetical protein